MTLYGGPVSSLSQTERAKGKSEVLEPAGDCANPLTVGCKNNVVAFPDPVSVEPGHRERYDLLSRRRRRWARLDARS